MRCGVRTAQKMASLVATIVVKRLFSKKLDFICEERVKKQIPVFICGMPRSGTTLCEQILSSHSQVTGAGELDFLTEVTSTRLIQPTNEQIKKFEIFLKSKSSLKSARNKYLEKLARRDKKNSLYICDKMPHNFLFIGLIKLILPESKIIYCKRSYTRCFSRRDANRPKCFFDGRGSC